MMNRHRNGILLALTMFASIAFASNAQATLIDFEDGSSGSPVGSFYTALGVEFANAEWINNTLPGMSGVMGIRAPGTYQFFQDNAVEIIFPNGVHNVSILGADVGANGLRMDAFNQVTDGSLIDFDEAYGTDAGVGQYYTVQTVGDLIYRVELYQIANNVDGEGIVLDNLEFDAAPPLPVPTLSSWSLVLLASLMLILGSVGFRRFH